MSQFQLMIKLLKKYIDFRMGLYGALFMGIIVWCVNYFGTGDVWGATTAAIKQAVYTLLFGGIIMRLCERLAVKIKKAWIAIALACIIPSFIAISLTFTVHSMRGTPKPLASTIPTALLVTPATVVWAVMKRRKVVDS